MPPAQSTSLAERFNEFRIRFFTKRVMGNSCGGDRDGNPRGTLGIDEITETVSTGDIVLYHTLHFVPHVQRVFTHSE